MSKGFCLWFRKVSGVSDLLQGSKWSEQHEGFVSQNSVQRSSGSNCGDCNVVAMKFVVKHLPTFCFFEGT